MLHVTLALFVTDRVFNQILHAFRADSIVLLDIIKMYIYSMERGETNFSHHLQGMVAWLSANGVAGCEFEVTQSR